MSDAFRSGSVPTLALAALGVVYGDIGTSPLYAVNEIFYGGGSLSPTPEHVAGIASLIIWMLITVVSVKYGLLALRADHKGEGGTLALFQIVKTFSGRSVPLLSVLLLFATGLLLGDAIITPAISVLSAVEGIGVISSTFSVVVLPLTLLILATMFIMQRYGTRRIGQIYGPIMLVWFISIGILGLRHIIAFPQVIVWALNPLNALDLVSHLSTHALFLVLGAALLAVTGAEALYADLGHLGKKAIRVGWFAIVFPSLALNYLGQAAYLMSPSPVNNGNIFYSMIPDTLQLPMVFLATAATVIASVALIFGMYSLASQAIASHIFPRLRIIHTNAAAEGQIYIPAVNWLLFAGSAVLIVGFGSASRLAAAYGLAVSGVMLITTFALAAVALHRWRWHPAIVVGAFGILCLYDALFFAAGSMKFFQGGWIPVLIGLVVFAVITTWQWGRATLRVAYDAYVHAHPMQYVLDLKKRLSDNNGRLHDSHTRDLVEMDRAVVFFISRPHLTAEEEVPVKIRVFLKRRGAIPRNMLLLNMEQTHRPYEAEHYDVRCLGEGVYTARASFGYMERPDASHVIRNIAAQGVFDDHFRRCSIEVSEDEIIIDTDVPWSRQLAARFFKWLVRWSIPRYRYFGLMDDAGAGLSKTVIPVHISHNGVRIEIPEFALREGEHNLDPDTLQMDTMPFQRV